MKAKLVKESLNEYSKIGRKLDWGLSADTRSPKEFASQIKELSDKTLLSWYKDFVSWNPSSQAKFQHRLVKLELEKRGLINESLNEYDEDNNLRDYEDVLWDELSNYLSPQELEYWKNGHIDISIKQYFENEWGTKEAAEHLYKRMKESKRFENEG